MRAGYRVLYPDEVGRWEADLVQISVYKGMPGGLELMSQCASACREKGVRYVVHPVSYPLLDEDTWDDLLVMAGAADLALILHDERAPGGGRLEGPHGERFLRKARELNRHAHVSFENAINTHDSPWFWEAFADSVTLDIGHMEAAGIDSAGFINSLDGATIGKVRFVHMHRNGTLRGGLTDHWPLVPGCRELGGLRALLKRKPGVDVILEINETGETGESLAILRALGEEFGS